MLKELFQKRRTIKFQMPFVIECAETYEKAALKLTDKGAVGRKRPPQAEDYYGVHPDIVRFYQAFVYECDKRNISVKAYQFLRSEDEQNQLYVKGVTKAKAGQSPHQFGCAVDIIDRKKAWNLSRKQWEIMMSIGYEISRKKKIAVINGGDWGKPDQPVTFWDPAHWELKNWREYRQIINYCKKRKIQLSEDTKTRFMKLDYMIQVHKNPSKRNVKLDNEFDLGKAR